MTLTPSTHYMIDDFARAVVATQILRALGRANDIVYHANPKQFQGLCQSIAHMNMFGCAFTEEQIQTIVDGEETETDTEFARYDGWARINQLLMDIYEQDDDIPVGEEDGLCRAQLATEHELPHEIADNLAREHAHEVILKLNDMLEDIAPDSVVRGLTGLALAFGLLLDTYSKHNDNNPAGMCDDPAAFRKHFADMIATPAEFKNSWDHFTATDWNAYAGATQFANGNPPYIMEFVLPWHQGFHDCVIIADGTRMQFIEFTKTHKHFTALDRKYVMQYIEQHQTEAKRVLSMLDDAMSSGRYIQDGEMRMILKIFGFGE